MNRQRIMYVSFLSILLLSGLALVYAQAWEPVTAPEETRCPTDADATLNQFGGNPLDLEGCQQYCRSIYGVDPYWYGSWGGGGGRGRGIGYAVCIQDCNREYWKAWDQGMERLGK